MADGTRPDPRFSVFLLVGQSNMEGIPTPEARDLAVHPRIKALAYDHSVELGRCYNEWHSARPPLHSAGAGVGPGDYFAKTLIEALPADAMVGLVPCAIKGVDIDFFCKGIVSSRRGEFPIPPDNHWAGAYEWVVSRAKLAQRTGVIRGILFHQGESDNGRSEWVDKVQRFVEDLRIDLELDETVPFVAGELFCNGRCAGHNELVHQLPGRIANVFIVSAAGLGGMDPFHFDLAGQRELGTRYGTAMCRALGLM